MKIQYITFSTHLFIQQTSMGLGQASQHKGLTHSGRTSSKTVLSNRIYVWSKWKITGIFDLWEGIPEVMESNWGQNCFFPSQWTKSEAR